MFPLLQFKSFRRIGVNSSINICENSPVKPLAPGLFFIERSLITDSIFLLLISLLKFSISSCQILWFVCFWIICVCLALCMFHPNCLICWHIIVHSNLTIFFIVVESEAMPPLSDFSYLVFSLFFSLSKGLSILSIFLKSQLLVLSILLFYSLLHVSLFWSLLSPSFC